MAADGARVVVGFDGSDGAQAALRWALETAAVDGSRVVAVAAWSLPIAPVAPWGPVPSFDEESLRASFEREIRGAVEEARLSVRDAGEVEVEVVVGFPGPSVVEAAAGARYLVVGRRGHGGFAGLLLGSVADHCARHSTVPVALVPPDGKATDGAVVVGVDGSDHAAAALRWGAEQAGRLGRPLVALYAWSWLEQPTKFDPAFDDEAARRHATAIVGAVLGERGVDVVAVNDLPARALIERSGRGDLVVVGSRGMGAVRQALLGSVSRQLAHHAPATVVVVN
jgi:nucleotide-binding universal stress UspA family protein